jgi:hypothetical protein
MRKNRVYTPTDCELMLTCHLLLLLHAHIHLNLLKDAFRGGVGAVFDIDDQAVEEQVLAL